MLRAVTGWPIVVLLVATIALTATVPSVRAADQAVTLVASNTQWHVGSASAPPNPTITVVAGDTLRLTVQNGDNFDHTFTITRFSLNRPLAASSTIFVNITTSAADIGSWQFYCAIPGHSSGSEGGRTGMVGNIAVVSSAPPAPGLDPTAFLTSQYFLIAIIVVVVVVIVAAVALVLRARRKAPKPPEMPKTP